LLLVEGAHTAAPGRLAGRGSRRGRTDLRRRNRAETARGRAAQRPFQRGEQRVAPAADRVPPGAGRLTRAHRLVATPVRPRRRDLVTAVAVLVVLRTAEVVRHVVAWRDQLASLVELPHRARVVFAGRPGGDNAPRAVVAPVGVPRDLLHV